MGKYTKLRGVVPAFVEESAFQEKVNAEKRRFLGMGDDPNLEGVNITRMAAMYADIKETKKGLEEAIAVQNIMLEALSQMLVEAIENQNAEKIALSSGATLFLQDTPYPSVKDKDAFMAWVKKNKMQAMLTMNFQTLKGIANEALAAGKRLPDGVEVYLKTQARLRNGNDEG